MTIGKISVAPCGHTGESIVGNYVRCLQGCEGAVVAPLRGQPGHVVNCACKPCQIRRKSVTIVLRSKEGKDIVTLPWDGSADSMRFIPAETAHVVHYKFLDADGKVVVKGNTDSWVDAGVGVTLKIDYMMDKAGMVVARGVIVSESRILRDIKFTIMGTTVIWP